MEVYVRSYAFPRVWLGATFLTIADLKTRAETQTNQSLARFIPSLSIGCTNALQRTSLVWIIDSRLLGLVLESQSHLPHQITDLRPTRLPDFVAAWRPFQRAPRIVIPATPQRLPPPPRSPLFAFASGLAHPPPVLNASSSQPGLLHRRSARSSLAEACRVSKLALVSCPRPETFWTLARDT